LINNVQYSNYVDFLFFCSSIVQTLSALCSYYCLFASNSNGTILGWLMKLKIKYVQSVDTLDSLWTYFSLTFLSFFLVYNFFYFFTLISRFTCFITFSFMIIFNFQNIKISVIIVFNFTSCYFSILLSNCRSANSNTNNNYTNIYITCNAHTRHKFFSYLLNYF
jgi:hypothetical protein